MHTHLSVIWSYEWKNNTETHVYWCIHTHSQAYTEINLICTLTDIHSLVSCYRHTHIHTQFCHMIHTLTWIHRDYSHDSHTHRHTQFCLMIHTLKGIHSFVSLYALISIHKINLMIHTFTGIHRGLSHNTHIHSFVSLYTHFHRVLSHDTHIHGVLSHYTHTQRNAQRLHNY